MLVALGVATLTLQVLPTVVLLARGLAPESIGTLLRPAAAEALRLSLIATLTSMSTVVLLGTPLAYLLARHDFRGRRLLDALVDHRCCCRRSSPEWGCSWCSGGAG